MRLLKFLFLTPEFPKRPRLFFVGILDVEFKITFGNPLNDSPFTCVFERSQLCVNYIARTLKAIVTWTSFVVLPQVLSLILRNEICLQFDLKKAIFKFLRFEVIFLAPDSKTSKAFFKNPGPNSRLKTANQLRHQYQKKKLAPGSDGQD